MRRAVQVPVEGALLVVLDTFDVLEVVLEVVFVVDVLLVFVVDEVDDVVDDVIITELEDPPPAQTRLICPSSYAAAFLLNADHTNALITFRFAPLKLDNGTVIVWVEPVRPETV